MATQKATTKVRKVLVIVSDKSCLNSFAIAFGKSLKSYQEKIKLYYNIDVADIINSPILDIIKKISN